MDDLGGKNPLVLVQHPYNHTHNSAAAACSPKSTVKMSSLRLADRNTHASGPGDTGHEWPPGCQDAGYP